MINTIKTLKITKKLPESTLQAMRNLNVNRIFKDKSFTSYFEDSIVQSSEYSEKEKEKMESFMTFWYNLIAIGCFLGVPENTDEVQDTVKAVYMNMVEIFMKEYDDFNQKISENEIIDFFSELPYLSVEYESKKMIYVYIVLFIIIIFYKNLKIKENML